MDSTLFCNMKSSHKCLVHCSVFCMQCHALQTYLHSSNSLLFLQTTYILQQRIMFHIFSLPFITVYQHHYSSFLQTRWLCHLPGDVLMRRMDNIHQCKPGRTLRLKQLTWKMLVHHCVPLNRRGRSRDLWTEGPWLRLDLRSHPPVWTLIPPDPIQTSGGISYSSPLPRSVTVLTDPS